MNRLPPPPNENQKQKESSDATLFFLWYTVNQNLRTRVIELRLYVIFKAHMDFTELVGKGPHDLEMPDEQHYLEVMRGSS